MPIVRPNNNIKNYTYLSSILIQIICSKLKSLYLQQTSRSDLGIWLEVFLSTLSEGYTSAILSDPVLRISRCLVYARREFWVIQPPSTTSKISNPLNILLLQTRPNSLGRSWNPSTKRPERQLHSWASMSATQHVWRLSQHEITSHLCFLSEDCLYPHSSLMMPEWGFLQRKMARKTLIKRWFYQIRARALARNKQQPSLASRDNLAWAHSFLRPQIFLFHLHLWRN